MSGRVFTKVPKPVSATPTHALVPKRSPRVQRQADEAQQENGPSIHGGAVFDFTTIPLFPPSRAGIQDKLRGGEPNDKYGHGAGQQAVTARHKPGSVLQRQDAGASEKIARKGLLTPAQETAAINYNRKRYKSNSIKIIQAITGTAVDGKFGPRTANAVAAFQQKQGLVVDGKAGTNTYKSIMRIGQQQQPQQDQQQGLPAAKQRTKVAIKTYSLKSGVVLKAGIKAKVKTIADAYYKATKKTIVITSGTRTASSQAVAMYGKLAGGDKLTVYRNQSAAKAIKKAYDDGVKEKKGKEAIIKDMTTVIEGQIKKGVYISRHLKAGAVDVRSRYMTDNEKAAFRKAAKGTAKKVILETTPPHFHLQF